MTETAGDDDAKGIHDEWWLDPIKYEFDAYGNPLYNDENPAHPSWRRMTNWHDLGRNGEYLRSTKTKWVYIHPSNNKVWHLAGPGQGREGVVLAKELEGIMQPDFEIRYSEGPYLIGAIPERVDYKRRRINLGVVIQPNGNVERPEEPNPFSYRLIEDSWWSSWSETVLIHAHARLAVAQSAPGRVEQDRGVHRPDGAR